MNPLLTVISVIYLAGFTLLHRRLRHGGATQAAAWALVVSAGLAGVILGAVTSGVTSLYEPSWRLISPLICDGQLEGMPRSSSYQAPLSRTRHTGLTTASATMNCVDVHGGSQPVTGRFLATSTVVYGGIFGLVLSWLLTLWRRPDAPTRQPASRPSSTASHRSTTITDRFPNVDSAQDGRRLTPPLSGASPRGSVRSFVTVNGRDVDAKVADEVQQLLLRLLGSSTPSDHSDTVRELFEKFEGAPTGDLDSRLGQLKHLLEQKLITDAEYAAAKAQLLSQL